jgi:multidrug efflux pump subunit AcrA (membrane-fusion protein)
VVALAMVEATVVANGRTTAVILVVGVCVFAVGSGCGREPKIVTPPAPEVSVSQPVEEPVQETVEFTGRVGAVDSVEVRARVTGYITKVAFTDGALVNVGDLLFEIDPREYQAAVLRSEGEVAPPARTDCPYGFRGRAQTRPSAPPARRAPASSSERLPTREP